MQSKYLFLLILSGLFHAFYNFLIRSQQGSRIFLVSIFISGWIFSLLGIILSGIEVNIFWRGVPYIFGAAVFFSFYQIFISRGFEKGTIAVVYPIAMSSPIFIAVLAAIFLGEILPLYVWLGILITVTGGFVVQLNAMSWKELSNILRFGKDYEAGRLALLAAMMYAIAAIFDKSVVGKFHVLVYVSILFFFMSIIILTYQLVVEKENLIPYIKENLRVIIPGGLILCLSFVTFRIALPHVYVSIAVPVRLVSILFAVILGRVVLKEKITRKKAAGIALVILGILLIQFFRNHTLK